ncbi:MAG: NfeD family protein [Leptolyngbya sp. Prado105]|jgi:membrane protein implicated in regulation of membrane protease activity|nr:NfeD family protein [Leptolyngbya sp. Prado105]
MNRVWQALKSFLSIADFDPESPSEYRTKVLEVGRIAVVCELLRPGQFGQVEVGGTWWTAYCLQELELPVGAKVKVIDRVDLTLVVEPVASPQVIQFRSKDQREAA